MTKGRDSNIVNGKQTTQSDSVDVATINLEDGLYILKGMSEVAGKLSITNTEVVIETDDKFEHNQTDSIKFYLVDTNTYVPLKVITQPTISANSDPKTEGDTIRLSQLNITLAPKYATLLEEFTTDHVNEMITIVIGEKAITKHKIREPIVGGNIQISRCTDNACEVLLTQMEKNIIK